METWGLEMKNASGKTRNVMKKNKKLITYAIFFEHMTKRYSDEG